MPGWITTPAPNKLKSSTNFYQVILRGVLLVHVTWRRLLSGAFVLWGLYQFSSSAEMTKIMLDDNQTRRSAEWLLLALNGVPGPESRQPRLSGDDNMHDGDRITSMKTRYQPCALCADWACGRADGHDTLLRCPDTRRRLIAQNERVHCNKNISRRAEPPARAATVYRHKFTGHQSPLPNEVGRMSASHIQYVFYV